MDKVQVHNKRLDVWFVVDGGNVYDANTMIKVPTLSREAQGALQFVEERMYEIQDKMDGIDPIWGYDLAKRHEYERQWLRLRKALYGNH